jgi:uncharacterized Zn-binding protein involved in type VI secretion
MNLKKLTAMTLTAALMLSNTVFASSVNTINKTVTVRKETAITDLYLKIEPRDEVETGSSIIINYTNATVPDQDVIDGKSSAKSKDGYKSGGYQYQGYNWDGSTGFYDVMSSIDSYEMPYIIKRTNSHQIEIFLLNMPGAYADSYLTEINGNKMEAIYRINLPIISGDEGDVGISIDSNSTSISDSVINSASIYKKGTTTSSSVTDSTTTTTEATTETTTETVYEDEDNDTVSKTDKTTVVKITIGSDEMKVNGKTYAVDVPAYIQKSSSSTLVPLRMVSVALGGGNVEDADDSDMVDWDSETKTAKITCGDTTVSFTAGSNSMIVNGEETAQLIANGATAEITDGRMFVPFRALAQTIGAEVDWDGETKTVTFTK